VLLKHFDKFRIAMAKSLRAEARNNRGEHLTVQAHDNDALILPVSQLEELHAFRPDLVDLVVSETQKEAAHRRSQESRVNLFVFIERVLGQISAMLLAVLGIAGGIYAGLSGQPWLGGVIVSVTIGTLAVTFIRRNQSGKN
jgi:hypothetical protein